MSKVPEVEEEYVELTDEQLENIVGGLSTETNAGGVSCPLCGGHALPTRLFNPHGPVYRCSECKHDFVVPKMDKFL